MDTAEIDEKAVLQAVSNCWLTAQEVVTKLGAPASAQRKITMILSILAGAGVKKVEARIRTEGKRGRPPSEYRRA